MKQQAGFTLIELIMVIVILGILAATALPRFADLGADARIAKMQGAVGALKSASTIVHAQWLAAGSPTASAANSTSTNSVITQENAPVAFVNGYPDVGGDGSADTLTSTANSGAAVAAGGLTDYVLAATTSVLTITPDTGHAACAVTYAQAAAGGAPQILATALTPANCQ